MKLDFLKIVIKMIKLLKYIFLISVSLILFVIVFFLFVFNWGIPFNGLKAAEDITDLKLKGRVELIHYNRNPLFRTYDGLLLVKDSALIFELDSLDWRVVTDCYYPVEKFRCNQCDSLALRKFQEALPKTDSIRNRSFRKLSNKLHNLEIYGRMMYFWLQSETFD